MGIDENQITSIPLITAGAVSQSYLGPVILIFHQYVHYRKGKSIHYPVQHEAFNNNVNDKSIKLGSLQQIETLDGYTFPLDFQDGMPYLPLRPFTDNEWEKLPHVFMTSNEDWDPNIFNNTISSDDK